MRDLSLFIVSLGAVLVNVCSSTAQNFDRSDSDEPVRMASDSLVVKSYKEVETSTMSSSSTPEDTDLQNYQGVMGRPGIDFPVYQNIPATNFNCREIKRPGYYADLATDCQVFHICDGGRKISFLCPNGTIFRQSHLICDWWFRVDCGKSVELYEESAEQLAADQKIYKARAEERERRRKVVKTSFGETEDELIGSEIYALDEPYDIRSNRKFQEPVHKSPITSTTTPVPAPSTTVISVRHAEERKGERNSKKVEDAKFPVFRQGKSDRNVDGKKVIEKISYVHPKSAEARSYVNRQNQNFNQEQTSTTAFVPRQSTTVNRQNQNFNQKTTRSYQTRANQNFEQTSTTAAYANRQDQNFNQQSYQNRPNQNFEQTSTTANRQDQNFNQQTTRSYQNRQNFEQTSTTSAPIHPVIVQKARFSGRNSISSSHKENIQPAASSGLFGDSRYEEITENPDSIGFTTEYPDLELKKTTTEFKFETTTYDSRRTVTPKYKNPDQERQHFAETASFTSNRGGRTFNDFANHFTKRVTSPPTSTSPSYKPTVPVVKTTPKPFKQNSRKVTPSSTTRGTTQRIPIENIYFTTSIAEKTNKSELDISLQELNIHKALSQGQNNQSYEERVREGLEVPPSSGPNALRSFALYFASDPDKKEKIGPYLSKDILIIPITRDIEDRINNSKTKEVVKQVDDIVKGKPSVSPTPGKIETLPNSLTQQTKNSYSALFGNKTEMADRVDGADFGTTGYESFTEQPIKINSELGNTINSDKSDLDGSQSRGLVEPDPRRNQLTDEFSRVSPDLRELAQVFTKALSAYLDDPEAFRKILSEIRPTEPSPRPEEISSNPIDYPSATQEDDEVLDFSDVTKASYNKKKTSTSVFRETTTEYQPTETTTSNDIENLVLPLTANENQRNIKIPDIELTAPLEENLDESQSRYYTPPPSVGTTNAIAEEINNEFSTSERLPEIDSNEAIDSYFPITGSVDDRSRPRYGGFQNNSRATTKYSPYGAELTSKTYSPYGADLVTTTQESVTDRVTTFNPRSRTSPLYEKSRLEEAIKNQTEEEIALAKELNNLAVPTKPEALPLHVSNSLTNNVEKQRTRKIKVTSTQSTTHAQEINLELSPPSNTEIPKGFLITYALEDGHVTYLPKPQTTSLPDEPATTIPPATERITTLVESDTLSPTTFSVFDSSVSKFTRATKYPSTTEKTRFTIKSSKSLQRITELQEELMFNSTKITNQQKERARIMVEETMGKMNMTDFTADTLMKMMEMAAKNETYRRLVLLLVNDKSGKNKTVEEARLSLLKALLTPITTTTKSRKEPNIETTTTTTTTTTTPIPPRTESRRRSSSRKSKSISNNSKNAIRTTTTTTTPAPSTPQRKVTTVKSSRRSKTTRAVSRTSKTTEAPTTTTTPKPSTVLGNLGLIRKTIENSKARDVRINSLEDAILDSDSRAIELLRSLYSLAARWG